MFEGTILQHLGLKGRNGHVDPPPLKELLTDNELQLLREHFNEEDVHTLAGALGKKLPDSQWFVDGILAQFYDPEAKDYERFALERERQLITLFLVYSRGQGFFLGIHLYWGLMMGLTPEQLTQQVMLVGAYGGIQLLNAGLTTLERTLKLLKELAQPHKDVSTPVAEKPTVGLVLGRLAETLGPILTR